MDFNPVPVVFVPSKARRGHDIAIYIHPEQRNLCHEWYYQKTLSDGQTQIFSCSGCKALKDVDRTTYSQPLPSCKIENGRFITDPLRPRRPHFCQPRSIPKAMAKRLVIERCKEIRSTEIAHPKQSSVEIAGILNRIASNRFEAFTSEQKEEMVAHIADPMERGRDNARHAISRAKQAARNLVVEDPELIVGFLQKLISPYCK